MRCLVLLAALLAGRLVLGRGESSSATSGIEEVGDTPASLELSQNSTGASPVSGTSAGAPLSDDTLATLGTDSDAVHYKAVLVVSQGRSGSTLVMAGLKFIPHSFIIPEPYYAWRISDTFDVQPPSYETLFSCKFFEDRPLLKKIMWSYACEYMFPVGNPGRRRCQRGVMTEADIQLLHSHCLASHLRVVKTIRFDRPHLRNTFKAFEFAHGKGHDLFLIHLVRRPWEISKSQFLHGWKPNLSVTPDVSVMDAMVNYLRSTCESIRTCARRLHTLSQETRAPLFTIRYEVIATLDESLVLSNLFAFVQETVTEETMSRIVAKIRSEKFAPLPTPSDYTERQAFVQTAEEDHVEAHAFRRVESCREVYTHFGYCKDENCTSIETGVAEVPERK